MKWKRDQSQTVAAGAEFSALACGFGQKGAFYITASAQKGLRVDVYYGHSNTLVTVDVLLARISCT